MTKAAALDFTYNPIRVHELMRINSGLARMLTPDEYRELKHLIKVAPDDSRTKCWHSPSCRKPALQDMVICRGHVLETIQTKYLETRIRQT